VTNPGLCGACCHGRRTGNVRGSIFWLCERSKSEPNYPRYPALPVATCPGFELQVSTQAQPPDEPTRS
jgi:hypothetical protein